MKMGIKSDNGFISFNEMLYRGEIENVIVSIIAASPFNWTISLRSLVTLNNLIIFVIWAVHESDVIPNAGFENMEIGKLVNGCKFLNSILNLKYF